MGTCPGRPPARPPRREASSRRAGRWRGSRSLAPPANLVLLELPPCSPEPNPMETVFQSLKGRRLAAVRSPRSALVCAPVGRRISVGAPALQRPRRAPCGPARPPALSWGNRAPESGAAAARGPARFFRNSWSAPVPGRPPAPPDAPPLHVHRAGIPTTRRNRGTASPLVTGCRSRTAARRDARGAMPKAPRYWPPS